MPWNLEITFSGLCVFLPQGCPRGWANCQGGFKGALLVNSNYSPDPIPKPHLHLPRLSFEIADLDDFPGNLDDLRPGFDLSTGLDGQQVGTVDLLGYEVTLEGAEPLPPLSVIKGRKKGHKPTNDYEAVDFDWVIDLKSLGVTDFYQGVWNELGGNNPVASKINIENGELRSKRVGRDPKGDPTLWEFYPRSQGLVQSLSDQAVLGFRNLSRAFKLVLKPTTGNPETFVFFSDQGKTVRVGISNLPKSIGLSDEMPLAHFRAFYNLFVDKSGYPIPVERRYAPVLYLEDDQRGVSGASVFCPDTQV